MYNLNVSLAATAASAANSLLVEGTSPTPRTPEILNSVIAMTNPLDGYTFGEDGQKLQLPPCSLSTDSNSSSSSQVESPTTNPPSVQSMCSQLIKAGLKLSIEQKRKHQSSEGEDLLDLDMINPKRIKKNESESEEDRIKLEAGLTPEDEERRKRRRERNKIAATKCRLKKRERTANLMQESETLETQNADLKTQLRELSEQRRQLSDMLELHRPHCPHHIGPATKETLGRLPPVGSVMDAHSYSRPASVDVFSGQNLEVYTRPASVCVSNNITYTRANMNYNRPTSIIVEEMGDFDHTFDAYAYNSQQCHSCTTPQSYNGQGMDNGCMA